MFQKRFVAMGKTKTETSFGGDSIVPDFAFKFVLLGDYYVGKTSMLTKIAGENNQGARAKPINNNSPHCLTSVILRGPKTIQMTVVDTGGQEKFRSLTASYYRGAHGCLLLFDVTKEDTFKNVTYWLHDLKEYSSHPDICTILVGAKCHVPVEEREVSTECAQKYAESVDLPYMEVSAENGTNVKEVFEKLADIIIEKITKSKAAMTLHTSQVILEQEKLKRKHRCSC